MLMSCKLAPYARRAWQSGAMGIEGSYVGIPGGL